MLEAVTAFFHYERRYFHRSRLMVTCRVFEATHILIVREQTPGNHMRRHPEHEPAPQGCRRDW